MVEPAIPKTDMRSAQRFVEAFSDAWEHPTPDRLVSLLHPDVRLVAPMMRAAVGREAARREFGRLLALLPGLRGHVRRWGANDNTIFIEFTLSATVGKRRLQWNLVDVFLIRDDLAVERVSYFDSIPLAAALMRRPGLVLKLLWLRLEPRPRVP